MQFVTSKENFARGIQAVQRAVSARGPLPILTHIKLATNGDGLKLTATDLEVGIEALVPAEVRAEGSIALTAKTLGEIIAKLPNADIELSTADSPQEVTLKCSRSKFTLRGLPAAEFPELPQAGASAVRLKADDLVKGIKQTAFAAGGEDKAVISGLFLSVKDGQMEIVATDGYRLAWRKAPVSDPTAELNVIVPKRAMDELARQVGAAGAEEVAIAMSNNQIALSFDDRYMTSRLVDGQYPPFRQIVPTTFACEAVLDRASLLGAVERVSIMAFDREAHIIKLEFGMDELKLSAGNSELGDSSEVVALEYTGEPMAISFNADFLVDALKNMDAETIRLGLNTPLSPVIIRPLDDDSHTCLLMPVNRV